MMGKQRRNDAAATTTSPRKTKNIPLSPNANVYPASFDRSPASKTIVGSADCYSADDDHQLIIHTTRRRRVNIAAAAILLSITSILLLHDRYNPVPLIRMNTVRGEQEYKGSLWHTDRTVRVDNVAQTPFARCDVHHVQSEDGKTTVDDWIFLEEMNAVNVAVVNEQGKFVVFQQQKYAIPGTTLSPVGGFIEEGEAPWEAARREVKEELGLGSAKTLRQMNAQGYDIHNHNAQTTTEGTTTAYESMHKIPPQVDDYGLATGIVPEHESDDWVFLGRYRTAANRGGGFIYTYLLTNAVPLVPEGGSVGFVPTGDDEAQDILHLTEDQVLKSVLKGEFQEVKWAATLSNSLLHMKSVV